MVGSLGRTQGRLDNPIMTYDPVRDTHIEKSYLDELVQINVRIPLRLRIRIDKVAEYAKRPRKERPESTYNWPSTVQGVVQEALEEYLSSHIIREKSGPKEKPPADLSKIQPKLPTEEEDVEGPSHPYRSARKPQKEE